MNTEEKAKAYDEALEKAKDFYKGYKQRDNQLYANDLETIFPELRESEDERIRQKFIKLVKMSNEVGGFALHKWEADEMLAWLEKQGKHTDKAEPKFEIGDEIKTKNEDPLTITKINEQGYWSGDLFICSFEDSAKWELVGKRINKLEPKFHEGDWIIHQGTENIYQVVASIDNQYQLRYGDNYTVQKCTNVDRCSRLWDISDAKDGDVLYSLDSKQPFIFKHRNPNKQAEVYCGINIYGKFFVGNTKDCIITTDKYVPATKEQRDTLERAITNAGYRWDKETHELKKISQRMVSAEAKEALYDKPAWSEEDMKEALRTEYEKGRADTIVDMYVPTQISPEESLGVSSEKYMDIVDTLTQGGQKPAKWSLGDERVIAIINNALTESNTPPDDYDKVYDWLESLRQRIGG